MNQKGNVILFIFIALICLILLVPAAMYFFKPIDLIMRVILAFLIFTTVRGFLGSGVVSLIITGVLIYILVIKWAYISGGVATILLVYMAFGLFSITIWGIGTTLRGK